MPRILKNRCPRAGGLDRALPHRQTDGDATAFCLLGKFEVDGCEHYLLVQHECSATGAEDEILAWADKAHRLTKSRPRGASRRTGKTLADIVAADRQVSYVSTPDA